MSLQDVYVPTGHTRHDMECVMRDTARILAAEAKRQTQINARASASPRLPAQSATARWNAAVAKHVKAGLPKSKAIRAVVVEDPDLHKSYLDEVNKEYQARRKTR